MVVEWPEREVGQSRARWHSPWLFMGAVVPFWFDLCVGAELIIGSNADVGEATSTAFTCP